MAGVENFHSLLTAPAFVCSWSLTVYVEFGIKDERGSRKASVDLIIRAGSSFALCTLELTIWLSGPRSSNEPTEVISELVSMVIGKPNTAPMPKSGAGFGVSLENLRPSAMESGVGYTIMNGEFGYWQLLLHPKDRPCTDDT